MTEKNDQATIATTTTPTEKASEPIDNSVVTKLQSLGVPEDVIAKIQSDLGAETVEDLAGLTEDDLCACGMKKLQARKVANTLKPPETPTAEMTAPTTNTVNTVSFDAILPPVPDDKSWLDALCTGGVLKIEQSTVISVIRAALGHRVGFFSIPALLVKAMEDFADNNEEQVAPEYYKLRSLLTKRSYGDIFAALEGCDGTYVTEARKKQLLQRIDGHLWPAIISFYVQLKSWQDSWMAGAANPAIMMNAIMSMNGLGSSLPAGMMQPPDTGILRDNADAVTDAINKVFAGTGVQIAAALAYDANRIKETLTNPRLPSLIGAPNRDQMLRQLGVTVNATYPRLEQNLTRFVLAIMQIKYLPSGPEELTYFGALFMLGSQIPFEQLNNDSPLTSKSISGIGGRNPRSLMPGS